MGHVTRCLALATELVKRKYNVFFVCRIDEKVNTEIVKNFNFFLLNSKEMKRDVTKDYNYWLGVEQEYDAVECINVTSCGRNATWVVDHYGINHFWEERISFFGCRVIVIDDLMRDHFADIIIDYNLTADYKRYFSSKLKKENAKYLMGISFSILREDILQAMKYNFSGEKNSCLLFLGTPAPSLFNRLIVILRRFNFKKLEILNPPRGFVPYENEVVISFTSNIAELYQYQRIVFGACGLANLERIFLGVPTISFSVSDNQKKLSDKIKEMELQFCLGDLNLLADDDIFKSINEILKKSHDELKDFFSKACELVPNDGVKKIVDQIMLI